MEDKLTKPEVEYWCNVYGIKLQFIVNKFGDRKEYNRKDISDYIFNQTKQGRN